MFQILERVSDALCGDSVASEFSALNEKRTNLLPQIRVLYNPPDSAKNLTLDETIERKQEDQAENREIFRKQRDRRRRRNA